MMNQEDIFKKVGQILNELQDQYEFLAQNPNQLNELELELFLANANFLSDHVQIVKKINSNKPQKAISEHSQQEVAQTASIAVNVPVPPRPSADELKEFFAARPVNEKTLDELRTEYEAENDAEPVDETPAVVIALTATELPSEIAEEQIAEPLKFEFLINDSISTDKFEFEHQSVDAIFDRPLSKEEEDIIAQKQRVRDSQLQQMNDLADQDDQPQASPIVEQEAVKPEPVELSEPVRILVSDEPKVQIVEPVVASPVVDKVEEQETKVADVSQPKPTLNDLLAGKNGFTNSLNEESNKTTISDLKQAINLNEKLLYIKDLFNGYNLAYAEAIELVNKMPDFKAADTFLQHNYAVKNNWASKQSTVDKFYELLNQRFPAK
uniref:hypothetical protein n=1 Tax=Pedobacter schmidteae TaxID=2201271 RepID=UPI000EB2DDDB|nr:hypothetical protein [Pedobacter schmidteae]